MRTFTVVSAVAIGIASAALGYALYFDYKQRHDANFRRKLSKSILTLVKEKKKSLKRGKAAKDANLSETGKEVDEADLPIEEILLKNGADRQKIFHKILMKGEQLLMMGPQSIPLSIEYFYKALKMVPTPTDLLVAFQKTLPTNVFSALVELIKQQDMLRVEQYFAKLSKNYSGVKFSCKEVSKSDGSSAKEWCLIAEKNYEDGELILQEHPVVSALSVQLNESAYCEHCQKFLDSEISSSCTNCNTAKYCSELCKEKAADYHRYLCSAAAAQQVPQEDQPYFRLRKVCKEFNSTLGMLLAKYLSLLLHEEISERKSVEESPFVHFEFLKSGKPRSSEIDSREILLFGLLFGKFNVGMIEFLSLERYLSLKATMRYNVYGFTLKHSLLEQHGKSDESLEITKSATVGDMVDTSSDNESVYVHKESVKQNVPSALQSCRTASTSYDAIGLYHALSHIRHSCSPNSFIKNSHENNELYLYARGSIKSGDEISLTYIPEDGASFSSRQLKLIENYQLICGCSACKVEMKAQ